MKLRKFILLTLFTIIVVVNLTETTANAIRVERDGFVFDVPSKKLLKNYDGKGNDIYVYDRRDIYPVLGDKNKLYPVVRLYNKEKPNRGCTIYVDGFGYIISGECQAGGAYTEWEGPATNFQLESFIFTKEIQDEYFFPRTNWNKIVKLINDHKFYYRYALGKASVELDGKEWYTIQDPGITPPYSIYAIYYGVGEYNDSGWFSPNLGDKPLGLELVACDFGYRERGRVDLKINVSGFKIESEFPKWRDGPQEWEKRKGNIWEIFSLGSDHIGRVTRRASNILIPLVPTTSANKSVSSTITNVERIKKDNEVHGDNMAYCSKVFSDLDGVIDFVQEEDTGGKGSVTINYKTEDGNKLGTEYKDKLELDKDYKFSAKTFTNYKVLGASEKTVKLSKSNPNQTIEFIYKKIDEDIPDPPIDTGDDGDDGGGGGGGGGGGDGDDPSCEELGTCPPPLPDPVHLTPCSGGACEPTLVTVAKPKYVQPDYGDISINLSSYLRDLPMDKTNNTGTQVDDLFNKGTADKISIKYTNIPVDGNLNYTGEEFEPSLTVRTKNYTLQIPANGSNNTVKTKTTTDYWSKYQSEGIKTDLIIYPVKDPSNLPTSKQQFFNLPSSEYIFKTTVTNKNTNLDNFKITKSGYYILGARLQGNGQTVIELVPLKISFSNENNWLPLPNNLSIQLNEHMLVTPSKRDDHNSSNLMCPGKNSLKVPSSYNNKYGITAIGSINNGGLKLYDSEMNNFTLANTTINNNDSITGILETPVGFIVSTSNNGIHYIDLATKKSFKIQNLPYNDINSLTEHKGKIVMTTNNGLVVGDLNMYFDSNNNIDSIVFTDVNLNKNFISSSELFGSTIQVGEVNNVMDKIVVAPKTSSGPATLKIVDTK